MWEANPAVTKVSAELHYFLPALTEIPTVAIGTKPPQTMTDTTQRFRAGFFAALMVTSIFGAGIAFGGGAAAASGVSTAGVSDAPSASTIAASADVENRGRFNWDEAAGSGEVGTGSTVYQGEDDITFVDRDGDTVEPSSLAGDAGDAEGQPLSMPIPQDQLHGQYDLNGPGDADTALSVRIDTPSITDFEVQNDNRAGVNGGVLTAEQDDARVYVEYNFGEAEYVELTVEASDGTDITQEILKEGESSTADLDEDGDSFAIDPSAVDAGEYTFTVEGSDDLDWGEASQSTTVTISSDASASLSLDSEEITRGSRLEFAAENSPEGDYHAVTIDSDNFRDGVSVSESQLTFRNDDDTSDFGVVLDDGTVLSSDDDPSGLSVDDVSYAYAVVEIDDGTGDGSIETQYLDTRSVTVDLYPVGAGIRGDSLDGDVVANNDAADTADFDVSEGTVSLTEPVGAYVVDSETDVNGTATEGIDEVAVYARNTGEFELVAVDGSGTIRVDYDDTFEKKDVRLSGDGLGNDILSLPGTYRLGVIDVRDADVDGDGNVDDTLTTSEFNSGVGSTSSLVVTDTELGGNFTTYGGQIASDDGQIDVVGAAPGQENVVVVLVDSRGNAIAEEVSVDDDGTFEREDIDISGLSEGRVTTQILLMGRDDQYGDDPAVDTGNLPSIIENEYASGSGTGDQVRDRILSNTVDATASDDQMVSGQFRLVDGRSTIETVPERAETGSTLTVEGTTNRAPDDATITVELLDENEESVNIGSVDEWGSDGTWSVQMSLDNVDPGEYTVEADDGDATDRATVEVVEEGSLGDGGDGNQTDGGNGQNGEDGADGGDGEGGTDGDDADGDDGTDGGEDEIEDQPGFGAIFALVALLCAASLAARRNG